MYPKKWTIQVGLAPVDPQRLQRVGRIDELALPLRSREADRIAAASWAAVLVDEGVADEDLAGLFSDLERKISRLDGERGLSRRDLYHAAPNQWGGNDQAMDEVLDEMIRISPAFDQGRREFSGIESTSILWLTVDHEQEHWPSVGLSALGANAVAMPPELGLEYWLESEPVDLLIVDGDINAEDLEKLQLRMNSGDLPPIILYRPSETSQQLRDEPGIEQADSPEDLLLTVLEIAEQLRLQPETAG
jgi:hypothetical protein